MKTPQEKLVLAIMRDIDAEAAVFAAEKELKKAEHGVTRALRAVPGAVVKNYGRSTTTTDAGRKAYAEARAEALARIKQRDGGAE